MFKVGDKVKCINPGGNGEIHKDRIYTVVGVDPDDAYEGPMLALDGVFNNRPYVYAHRFVLVRREGERQPRKGFAAFISKVEAA